MFQKGVLNTKFITAREKEISRFSDLFALLFAMITYAVFNLLLVNKFFPITEGWFQDAANYILSGDKIYSDFYMFVPPGFPLLTALVSALSNNSFLFFRYLGIVERLLMLALVYCISRRLFSPMVSAISSLAGAVLYIANIQEIFYGYYQTSLFLGLICVWLCIKMYEAFESKPYGYAVVFGVCAALSFMFKQTLGLLLSFAIGTMFLASVYFVDLKKAVKTVLFVVLGCVAFFIISFAVMAASGTLEFFVAQVFGGASSKGSLLSVLFGFWPRILTKDALVLFVLFISFFVLALLQDTNIGSDIKVLCYAGQWITLVIAALLFANVLFTAFENRDRAFLLTREFIATMLVGLFILAAGAFFMCQQDKSKLHRLLSPLVLLIGFIFLMITISSNKQSMLNFSIIRDFRQHFIFAIFLSELLVSIFLLYRVAIRKETALAIPLIICVASWSIMYIHGFSYTIEDHSTFLSLTLFLGFLLSASVPFERVKKFLALVLACGIILTVFYQRNWFTYHWWGVNMTNTTYDATETFDDPHLKGIYANKETVEPMNEIYAMVEKYKHENSTLYSFPHIAYFNVMSDLPSPTFSKTHYFDVCSDEQAEQDAVILLEQHPDFIVWLELSEETWVIHEDAFRNGERSGQRSIQEAYNQLVGSGEYTLLGVYHIYYSDPVYLWVKTSLYNQC